MAFSTARPILTGDVPSLFGPSRKPRGPDHKETLAKVWDLWARATEAKAQSVSERDRHYADQILQATNVKSSLLVRTKRAPEIRERAIQSFCLDKIAILTSIMERYALLPLRSADEDAARKYSSAINATLEEVEADSELNLVQQEASYYGSGYWKVGTNPSRYGGRGGPDFKAVCRDNVLLDPACTSMEDARFVIQFGEMWASEVVQNFGIPISLQDAKIIARVGQRGGRPGEEMHARIQGQQRFLPPRPITGGLLYPVEELARILEKQFQTQRLTVVECWTLSHHDQQVFLGPDDAVLKPGEDDEEIHKARQTGVLRGSANLRSPSVHRTVVIGAPDKAGMVVMDGPSPYTHGMLPYCQIKNFPTRDPYGEGDPSLVGSHQTAANVITISHMANFLKFGFPQRIMPEWGDEKQRTDEIGEDILFRDPLIAQSIKYLQPAQIPGYSRSVRNDAYDAIRQGLSHQDILSGKNPANVQSGEQLEILSDFAMTRIGLSMREREKGLERAGKMLPSLIEQNWPVGREIRVPDPAAPPGRPPYKWVEFDPYLDKMRGPFEVIVTGRGSRLEKTYAELSAPPAEQQAQGGE